MTRNFRWRGTTIIEVVMALAILSIALPSLIGAFADASNLTIHPAQSTVAQFLAIDRMEEIVARRYRGTDGYVAVSDVNFPNESAVSGFPAFQRSVTIAFVTAQLAPSAGDQGYKKVTVTVSWNSGAQRVMLERLFADY